MEISANDVKNPHQATQALSLLKGVVRYLVHLFVLYQVFGFAVGSLTHFVYKIALPAIERHPATGSEIQFFFSHLLVFSIGPAFLSGLLINAKFRHGVARWVWVVPVVILAFCFVMVGPGMYPTMLLDSNWREAFHYYFGGGLDIPQIHSTKDLADYANIARLYSQLKFTMPAYAGIAYSLGAWLGMNKRVRKLQAFMDQL